MNVTASETHTCTGISDPGLDFKGHLGDPGLDYKGYSGRPPKKRDGSWSKKAPRNTKRKPRHRKHKG